MKTRIVTSVQAHPNADKLDIICLDEGWECIVKKGEFVLNQRVLFIPPDAVVPKTLHEFLGITNYLGKLPGDCTSGSMRIKAARLRGIPSFGVVISLPKLYEYSRIHLSPEDQLSLDHMEEDKSGDLLPALLNITKYVPVEKVGPGDAARPLSWFHTYTDIENYRNFPYLIPKGTSVVVLEKINGSNFRGGYCISPESGGELEYMAGSHNVQRKEFDENGNVSLYWTPMTQSMRDMLRYIATNPSLDREEKVFSVIAFGEIFGEGVQDMTYGVSGKTVRIFDIAINGKYIDWDKTLAFCNYFQIPTVPELDRGEFSDILVKKWTDGPTTVCPQDRIRSKFTGREGIVIKPLRESVDKMGRRLVVKSISVDYLNRKNPTDNA